MPHTISMYSYATDDELEYNDEFSCREVMASHIVKWWRLNTFGQRYDAVKRNQQRTIKLVCKVRDGITQPEQVIEKYKQLIPEAFVSILADTDIQWLPMAQHRDGWGVIHRSYAVTISGRVDRVYTAMWVVALFLRLDTQQTFDTLEQIIENAGSDGKNWYTFDGVGDRGRTLNAYLRRNEWDTVALFVTNRGIAGYTSAVGELRGYYLNYTREDFDKSLA